jgi:hypothetical protein
MSSGGSRPNGRVAALFLDLRGHIHAGLVAASPPSSSICAATQGSRFGPGG